MNAHEYWPATMPRLIGAALIVSAALTSLGYSVVAGELSFLAIYLLCLIVGSLIALITSGSRYGQVQALSVFLVVYSLNVLMVLAFAYILVKQNGTPFLTAPEGVIPDDERFYEYGASIAQSWLRGEASEFPLGVKFYGYPFVLAACNYFSSYFGDMSAVSPRLLNAAVGALLPVTVYRIADLIYENTQVSRLAATLTALFPVFTYYSALLLRDMIVAYLIVLAILLFLRGTKLPAIHHKLVNAGMLTTTLVAVFFIRDLSAAVLLAGFAFYVFVRQPGWTKLLSIVIGVVIAAQVVAAIDLDAPKVRMYLTYTARAMEVFERIESQDSLGMKYIIGAPFPFNLILRIPYTALMPIPPIVGTDVPNLVRGSGALIWYFLFPLWVYGMWHGRNNAGSNLIAVVSLLFLVGIAMVSIDLRHKTQYLPLAMIHVSFAAHKLDIRTSQVLSYTLLVLGVLGVAYLFLRFAG